MRIVDSSKCGEDAELLGGFGAYDLAYAYFCKGLYNSVFFFIFFFNIVVKSFFLSTKTL